MASTFLACSSAPPSSPAPTSGNGDSQNGGVGPDSVTLPLKGDVVLLLERYSGDAADGSTGPTVRFSGEVFPRAATVGENLETFGPCEYRATAEATPGAPRASSPSQLDVGTIRVEGGLLPDGHLTATPANTTSNAVEVPNLRAFEGGETFSFHAAGGSVPGVETIGVIAPHDIVVTSPALDGAAPPELDRGVDLVVSWSGASQAAEKIYLSLLSHDVESKLRKVISCKFNAIDGQGTIPAAALAHLPLTNDATLQRSFITMYPVGVTARRVGEWQYEAIVSGEINFWLPKVTR